MQKITKSFAKMIYKAVKIHTVTIPFPDYSIHRTNGRTGKWEVQLYCGSLRGLLLCAFSQFEIHDKQFKSFAKDFFISEKTLHSR